MKLRVIVLALLAAAVVLVVSCGPPPVSISDRIAMFVSDINSNPGNAYTECDPNAGQYNAAKTANFWTSLFRNPTYTTSGLNDSNSSAVTVTFNGLGGAEFWTFGMVNNKNMGSDNWLISKVINASGSTVFQ